MELNNTPIRVTSAFTITPKLKSIVVEASDLPRVSIKQPLYDDACDVGVVLYNSFTGRTTRWYLHEERGSEDLEVTVYKPTHESVRKFPGLTGWELHILND